MIHQLHRLLAIGLVATLAACATSNPDVISRHDAQRMSVVQQGTVLSIRPVVVDGSQSGIGGAAGGVVGGIAGSSVGGRRDGAIVGVLAAVAGAVIGNAIERNATREEAIEVLVQLRNGERRAIVQGGGSERLMVGDPVAIVTTGGKARVTRASGSRGGLQGMTAPQTSKPARPLTRQEQIAQAKTPKVDEFDLGDLDF